MSKNYLPLTTGQYFKIRHCCENFVRTILITYQIKRRLVRLCIFVIMRQRDGSFLMRSLHFCKAQCTDRDNVHLSKVNGGLTYFYLRRDFLLPAIAIVLLHYATNIALISMSRSVIINDAIKGQL